jgi:predicted amidohydrolase
MMQDTVDIQLLQTELVWEKAQDNCDHLAQLMDRDKADISLLPEMFNSGFSMSPARVAEPMDGPTVGWMVEQARRLDRVVAGSLAIREGEACFNRFIWVTPDGEISTYDKRHLFAMAGEHKRYTAGADRVIWHWRGWRILPLVCYDLRFPVWSRQQAMDYDLMLVVANWPSPRSAAWNRLLPARAIENQCYLAAVNRVGEDGRGWRYDGGSVLLDDLGDALLQLDDRAATGKASISLAKLKERREQLPFYKDADDFRLL